MARIETPLFNIEASLREIAAVVGGTALVIGALVHGGGGTTTDYVPSPPTPILSFPPGFENCPPTEAYIDASTKFACDLPGGSKLTFGEVKPRTVEDLATGQEIDVNKHDLGTFSSGGHEYRIFSRYWTPKVGVKEVEPPTKKKT